jgi:hypothetical protein
MVFFAVLVMLGVASCASVDRPCGGANREFCSYARELEVGLQRGNLEPIFDRLNGPTFGCPVIREGVEPCTDEPPGAMVRRVSRPELFVINGGLRRYDALVSLESYARFLGDTVRAVRPGELDWLNDGVFRIYAVGEERDGPRRSVLVTAIITTPSGLPGRISFAFESSRGGDGWRIDQTVTIAPDWAGPQMWVVGSRDEWLWRKWVDPRAN